MTKPVQSGAMIGKYRIVRQVGAGGMGEVYRAEDTELGRPVALKVLPQHVAADRDWLARFEREARAASSLNHPNILTIHELGREGDLRFIASEFIDGETLRQRLQRDRIDTTEAVGIGGQIAAALAAAHGAGLLHRDIKPENVMIRPDGLVKVIDFGLGKQLAAPVDSAPDSSATAGPTRTAVVAGTLPYMAPERIRGLAATPASDIFALGAVIYEMLTGRPPFEASTAGDLVVAILTAQAPPIGTGRSGVPRSLGILIHAMLEKDPAQRPGPASQIGADLEAKIRDTDHRVPKSAAHKRKMHGDSIAVLPLANAMSQPGDEYLGDGISDTVGDTLCQIAGLKVIARSTAVRLKHADLDPLATGRQLGVRTVLTGRIARLADRVIVRAELVDVETGAHLWGGQFARAESDLFIIQEEISREIAQRLRVALSPRDHRRLASRQTSAEGYRAFLKGRRLCERRSHTALRAGIESLSEAIAHDPTYAPAHAGLADAYASLSYYGLVAPREVMPKAKAAALRAIEIDRTLGEGHAALGWVALNFDWDWALAEREFTSALRANPGSATAHYQYAIGLMKRRDFEKATAEANQAQELDPLSPLVTALPGLIGFYARRYSEAMAPCTLGIEMDPRFAWVPRLWRGFILREQKHAGRALDDFEEAVRVSDRAPVALGTLAHGYAIAGHRDRARDLLTELLDRARASYVPAFFVAIAYIGLGEQTQALEWLERTVEERSNWALYFPMDPFLDPLRDDPRFAALQEQVRL